MVDRVGTASPPFLAAMRHRQCIDGRSAAAHDANALREKDRIVRQRGAAVPPPRSRRASPARRSSDRRTRRSSCPRRRAASATRRKRTARRRFRSWNRYSGPAFAALAESRVATAAGRTPAAARFTPALSTKTPRQRRQAHRHRQACASWMNFLSARGWACRNCSTGFGWGLCGVVCATARKARKSSPVPTTPVVRDRHDIGERAVRQREANGRAAAGRPLVSVSGIVGLPVPSE